MKSLSYETLINRPADLKRFSGLNVQEFQQIVYKTRPLWDKKWVDPKLVSGRPWALGALENHILALLIYYRFYIPHTFLGMMFGVDDSVICRSFRRIEPILCAVTKFKKEQPISDSVRVYADSGYQCFQKMHPQVCIPFKRTKLKKLDSFQKQFNRELSRKRVKVENVFADMKRYKILQERYRNKRENYHVKMKIVAGLVNLKTGF